MGGHRRQSSVVACAPPIWDRRKVTSGRAGAQAFAPDMNWLRLWAANGNDDGDALTQTLEDPDMLADEGRFQVINIGCVPAAALPRLPWAADRCAPCQRASECGSGETRGGAGPERANRNSAYVPRAGLQCPDGVSRRPGVEECALSIKLRSRRCLPPHSGCRWCALTSRGRMQAHLQGRGRGHLGFNCRQIPCGAPRLSRQTARVEPALLACDSKHADVGP